MDEDVLEWFTKQRTTSLGSEVLKNPEDPMYPLVKEYPDVVSKNTHHPNSCRIGEYGTRLISCLAQSIVSRGNGLYLASMMPQGLSNAPATFNRLVTQLFRPLRTFAHLHKYSAGYAELARPLSDLLKKDADWRSSLGFVIYTDHASLRTATNSPHLICRSR
ncbi:Reverse transcriptase [Phytophthora palmivora]|uniref:Reverse transcriptase n=1 Tax=Phytophthora palmivora TaxID=4796 RepID=A0A2P4YA93_9STRA|nr:Reverse transcriptase [Phytophthora palmivora]